MTNTQAGFTNEETYTFMLHERDNIIFAIQVGMDYEEIEDLVYTHVSLLAENEQMENLSDVAREYALQGFDKVNINEVAQSIYNDCKEAYELA